jgi:hypothetical protein
MPYDLRIIRSGEFVRADAAGQFDLDATRTLLQDVMWACVRSRIGRVMLDIRDAHSDMTAAQLCALAVVTQDITPPPGQHKIAILTRPELQFDRAALLAGTVQDIGWNLAAFHDFETAFEWIIS